jgi:thioredoxin-like negative regulator of GroEL
MPLSSLRLATRLLKLALAQARQFDESVELLQRGLEAFPDNKMIAGMLYHMQGIKLLRQRQVAEAIERFKQSAVNVPTLPDNYIMLAALYARTGQINEAIQQTKKAFETAPERRDARGTAYEIFKQSQRYDDAIHTFQNAIERRPSDLQLRKWLIEFQLLANRAEEARSVLDAMPTETVDDLQQRLRLGLDLVNRMIEAGELPKDQERDYLEGILAELRKEVAKVSKTDVGLFDALEHWLASPQNWLIAGPFPGGENFKGFDHELPPEKAADPKAEYEGARGRIQWRPINIHAGEYVDLLKVWPRSRNVVAYALTFVQSSQEQTVTLRVGSDDGVKMWLNDNLVLERRVYRPFAASQDEVSVTLREGTNKLLVKIDQGTADWGFAIEPVDARGWPAVLNWPTEPPLPGN